jgi:tetratricopeptide (TPR) repeat protein
MPKGFAYDVFVSYSHRDKEWVRGELLSRLEEAGLRVCIDYRDSEIGAPIVSEMERAVAESRKTVLVLTPAYLESNGARFESLMLQNDDPSNRRLQLIPLLKEDCEIPRHIRIFNHLDFTKSSDWSRLLAALDAPRRKDRSTPTRAGWDLVHPYGMPPNFTGRGTERALLSKWLEGRGPALFVLRALGGFGKSALVWHWLLHDVDPARWGRVLWWCFYEPDAPFEHFLAHTLEYFGLDPKGLDAREQVEKALSVLRREGHLLLLDGFERELRAFSGMGSYQGEEEIARLGTDDRDCINSMAEIFLRGVVSLPDLRGRVLLTTRLRPRILEDRNGEVLSGFLEKELSPMRAEEAVDFFHAEGIQGTRSEILAACEPYGFHPLSLKLLAGMVQRDLRTPRDIAATCRLDVSGNLIQRQHHVLEQAYGRLRPAHRDLLSRIACFRGSISYDAVVTAARETRDREIDKVLHDLVVRGLLQHDQAHRRFDLHPIVRRFAYDRLGEKDRESAHRELRNYFAAIPPPQRVQTLADLSPVIELYHHMMHAGEYEAAFELLRHRILLIAYFHLGAYELCIGLLQALFLDGKDYPPRLKDDRDQAWILNSLANSYSLSGQPRRALTLYERAIRISAGSGDSFNAAVELGALAAVAQLPIGALKSGDANLRKRITTCLEIGQESREGTGRAELGRLLSFRGFWEEAEEELVLALGLFERLLEVQHACLVWAYRALRQLLFSRTGKPSAAQHALTAAQRSLDLAEEAERRRYPYPRDYVRSHWLLGAARLATGNLIAAERHLNDALSRCHRINMVDHEADILIDLGRLRRKTGDVVEARNLTEDALAITERCGYVLQGADVHLLLAQLDLDENRPAAARVHAAEARRLATCDGPPDYTYKVAYDEAGAMLAAIDAVS